MLEDENERSAEEERRVESNETREVKQGNEFDRRDEKDKRDDEDELEMKKKKVEMKNTINEVKTKYQKMKRMK